MTWLRTTGLRLLLALGLAFSLWVFVSFTQNPERRSAFDSVPVDIEGLPANLIVVDQEGLPRANRPTVNITVQGDEQSVLQVKPSDLRAFADLSSLGPGDHNNVPVNVVPNRSGLARLTFTSDPGFLAFRLEQEITRTVPLTVELAGSVPFSFEAGTPRLTDEQGKVINTVVVRGPQSRVERVNIARVTANIDRLTANYTSRLPAEPLGQDRQPVAGVTVEPASISVLVPIASSAGLKRVPVVPNLVGAPASGYIVNGVSVEPQFVRLTGSSGSLDTVQSIGTAEVDITGASRTVTRTVELRPPANTGLDTGEPAAVVVTVRIGPLARPLQVTLPAPIQVVDVPDGLLVSLSPQSVQVTLTGTAAQFAALDPAALQGTVSVRERGPGSYTLTPSFQIPQGITLAEPQPRVTVTLRAPATATPAPTQAPPAQTAAPAPTEAPTATPPPPAPGAPPTATPTA